MIWFLPVLFGLGFVAARVVLDARERDAARLNQVTAERLRAASAAVHPDVSQPAKPQVAQTELAAAAQTHQAAKVKTAQVAQAAQTERAKAVALANAALLQANQDVFATTLAMMKARGDYAYHPLTENQVALDQAVAAHDAAVARQVEASKHLAELGGGR